MASKVGMTPKQDPMPQTLEEWKRLGDLYEEALLREKEINSSLRAKINGLQQKISLLKRERI